MLFHRSEYLMRKFEVAKGFENQNINLPKRSTAYSAGYDIESAEDVIILPLKPSGNKTTMIKTGIKVQMNEGEYLAVYPRSSIGVKNLALMPNSVGIIDRDYYNNPDNDGHIMVPLINLSENPIRIKKGDRIAQGIFHQFLTVDDEEAIDNVRSGGFGSTGVN